MRVASVVGGLLVTALVASRANAAEPSAADKETSRALFAQGMAALDVDDYAGVGAA
jgi:hypothetical protein